MVAWPPVVTVGSAVNAGMHWAAEKSGPKFPCPAGNGREIWTVVGAVQHRGRRALGANSGWKAIEFVFTKLPIKSLNYLVFAWGT